MDMFATKATSCAQITKRKMIKPTGVIAYPYVSGLNNRQAEYKINCAILDGVNQLIRKQNHISNQIVEMVGTYEIKLNNHCLLSLTLSNYAISKHAAHGMTYQISYTFNLNTGHIYSFPELFKPGSSYISQLSGIVKQQIQDNQITLINEFTSIDENQPYFLTEQDLVLYFPIYKYTPYYYGHPNFPIPYKDISDLIDPYGPLCFAGK